jgi:hypothetical protein
MFNMLEDKCADRWDKAGYAPANTQIIDTLDWP